MLRFWPSKLHFWRKSRTKASFLSFNASFLKEVSQKSFVFELQSFIFEGSLAEMLRFWASKLHFWKKSRTKASFLRFLSFTDSFLKEVSQKCFVFEFQSFHFEGSLAQKLFRFWASKFHFWRKSRRKASFLNFKASFLKEVSQKCFVFEFQSFNFEGSLAQKLRFWASKRLFGGSLAEKLRLTKSFEPQTIWHPNRLNLKSIDNQLIWISNRLTTNSFESQSDWPPNHLNLKSIDNQTTWISNPLTTTSLESQIGWRPNHLNLKSMDNHLNWISNQLPTKIIWISDQMTTKSFDSQLVWIWHQLTFEPIELRTLPSYRFLIFGNFRHRLVR